MAKLVWAPQKSYESGLDHGVIYPATKSPGVALNGIVSITEGHNGGEQGEYYLDGKKYYQDIANTDFKANLSLVTYPQSLANYTGEPRIKKGLILTRQPRARFHLSYRNLVGEDYYKIHLLYNCLATPTGRGFATQSDTIDPIIYTFDLACVPIDVSPGRPTAHIVLDSRKIDPYVMADIEGKLYGYDGFDPTMQFPIDLGILANNVITEPLSEPL